MALDMWLVSVMAGLLTAALSGSLTPAPLGTSNASLTLSQAPERGDGSPASSLTPGRLLGVRLVDGRDHCSGTVQVRRAGSWENACGASWEHSATEAVCRALGCGVRGAQGRSDPPRPGPTGRHQPRPAPPSPDPPGPTATTGNASRASNTSQHAPAPSVRCPGPEWHLCEVLDQPCDRGRAWVTCPETQDLLLVAGRSRCEGRVELLEHGQWGSVCDDSWDLAAGHVVCRQLGCGWAIQVLPGLHFPPGQGPIHRDQVNCSGAEAFLWDCPGQPGRGYCGHKEDAGVVCSGAQRPLNLSTSEAYTSVQTVTDEPAVTVQPEPGDAGELRRLLPCAVLGTLLLCALAAIAALLRAKRKYALPITVNRQHPPTSTPAGANRYSEVTSITPKEAAPLPAQVPADSDSDSDYEHYDFSAQPPVALSTFYNSQRCRISEEQLLLARFQMPPLEEDTPSLGPRWPARGSSASSTSSGEGHDSSPDVGGAPWHPPAEWNPPPEQPPGLGLLGTQETFTAGPSAADSSSTSSGEWYQNFKPPPPSQELFACPGSPSPQPNFTDNEDYDDIGAA